MNHAQSDDWVPECLHPDTAERMAEQMHGELEYVDPFYVDPFFRRYAVCILRAGLLATALSGRTAGHLTELLRTGNVQALLDILQEHAEHMPTRWNEDLQNLTYGDKDIREGVLQTARMALETGIPRNTNPPLPPSQIR